MTPQPEDSLRIDEALRQGIARHQSGQLEEAERLYRGILEAQPNHPDAHHNLGVLAVQVNQADAGLPHLKAALELNPSHGQFWISYLEALIQTGQKEAAHQVMAEGRRRGLQGEAVEVLAERLGEDGQAKHSQPSSQQMELLVAQFTEGQYAEAEVVAKALTEQFPQHGFGWKVLGALYKQLGRTEDALPPMQKAAALSPEDAAVHSNLGVTLHELGRLEEAETSLRLALEINPDLVEAHSNLGATLKGRGFLADAAVSYRRALEIKPDHAAAHNNLGNTLK